MYLATADRWGNLVSFIYSVYDTFGSGVTVPGFGFVLNDRGALFSLDPRSPNVIAPRKRPFPTLLPGFLMKQGKPVMAFGLMGGNQQAQGHAQVLVSRLDMLGTRHSRMHDVDRDPIRPELIRQRLGQMHQGRIAHSAHGFRVARSEPHVIEQEQLMVNARRMGDVLQEGLRSLASRHPALGEARGAGLFVGRAG